MPRMIAKRIARRCTQRKPPSADHTEFVICDHTIDITYIRLAHEFAYLAILLDVLTRRIRGWEVGLYLDSQLTLRPLQRALQVAWPAIHHSDQGVQYAARGYVTQLAACGVQISMARAGQPRENAYAERVIRTIKEEEVYLNGYQDLREARENLASFIDEVYQHKRIHSALGYLTPAEFEAQWRRQNPDSGGCRAGVDRRYAG